MDHLLKLADRFEKLARMGNQYIISLRSSDGTTTKTYPTIEGAREFAYNYLGVPDDEGRYVPDIYDEHAITDHGDVLSVGGDLTWDLLYPQLEAKRKFWREYNEQKDREREAEERDIRDMPQDAYERAERDFYDRKMYGNDF